MRMFLLLFLLEMLQKYKLLQRVIILTLLLKLAKPLSRLSSCCISPLQIPICCHLHYTSSPIEKIAYFMKLVGWEQLATQGVPRWQVHKRVAGGSQRRGSVASPVMIGSSRKCAGNHPLSAGSPRQGATHYLQVVYSCALFQRGSPRAAALKAIMAVSGLRPLLENYRFRRILFP